MSSHSIWQHHLKFDGSALEPADPDADHAGGLCRIWGHRELQLVSLPERGLVLRGIELLREVEEQASLTISTADEAIAVLRAHHYTLGGTRSKKY